MLRQSNKGERVDLIIGNLLFQQNITGNQSDTEYNLLRCIIILGVYSEYILTQLQQLYKNQKIHSSYSAK